MSAIYRYLRPGQESTAVNCLETSVVTTRALSERSEEVTVRTLLIHPNGH